MRVPEHQRKAYVWRWTAALGGLAVLALTLVTAVVVAPSQPAHAVPNFVVDSLLDAPDAVLDGICATAGAVCTLRAALDEANADGTTNTITFAGGLSGTIPIWATLSVSDAAGGTAIAGPADHSIIINGAGAGAGPCFAITSDGNTIRNLVINSCGGDGIEINSANSNIVAGNRIGTNAAGTAPVPNIGHGVNISGTSTLNTIGGTATADRNLISGNTGNGVEIDGTASVNTIRGNYIGTDVTGSAAVIGNTVGINIGGTAASNSIRDNVIGGNTGGGIVLGGAGGNLVYGNSIGLGANGIAIMGNAGDGIENTAGSNIIGGTASGQPNTIAHNTGAAVNVTGGAASIRQNSMFLNTGVGILHFGGPGVPTIPVATFGGGTFTIGGAADPFAVVEVFLADPGGDEGETYVQSYIADGAGNWGGSLCVTGPVAIAASATDTTANDTSAFGLRNLPVGTCGGAPAALFIDAPSTVPPEGADFQVIVIDLNGWPIQGETVECSLSPVGGPIIVVPQTATTGSDGRAAFLLVPTGASWVPGQELTLTCFLDSNPDVQASTTLVMRAFVDTDGDGVPDTLDSCPYSPEDLDGFQDADGCPEADNDMDGICDPWLTPALPACDGSDLCPNIPEDHDAFQDTDGCPEPDNDGDGFPDSTDQCPGTDWTAGPDGIADSGDEPLNELGVPIQTKEDYDGVIDTDGCHDSPGDDYDADGLSDEDEVFIYGTDPTIPDTDGDGLSDGAEVNTFGTDPLVPDTDADGCADGEEVALGSVFDPTAAGWYDVFDVPVPAYADPRPNGPRSREVSMGDVLAVLFYAYADEGGPPNGNGVAYDSDKDSDTVPDGRDYDRTPGLGPDPVTGVDPAGPPNGVIDIGDALIALAQAFAVDCSGPP